MPGGVGRVDRSSGYRCELAKTLVVVETARNALEFPV